MHEKSFTHKLRSLAGAGLVVVLAFMAPVDAVQAGQADVLKAVAQAQGGDSWRFDVTIRSADTGWDYYCDRFEIVGPQGKVLGTRILGHPHETEQPFTRSLSGVAIPDGVDEVTVRAAMKPDGAGGEVVTVRLR